jgi:hypothetical protein
LHTRKCATRKSSHIARGRTVDDTICICDAEFIVICSLFIWDTDHNIDSWVGDDEAFLLYFASEDAHYRLDIFMLITVQCPRFAVQVIETRF